MITKRKNPSKTNRFGLIAHALCWYQILAIAIPPRLAQAAISLPLIPSAQSPTDQPILPENLPLPSKIAPIPGHLPTGTYYQSIAHAAVEEQFPVTSAQSPVQSVQVSSQSADPARNRPKLMQFVQKFGTFSIPSQIEYTN